MYVHMKTTSIFARPKIGSADNHSRTLNSIILDIKTFADSPIFRLFQFIMN